MFNGFFCKRNTRGKNWAQFLGNQMREIEARIALNLNLGEEKKGIQIFMGRMI